MLAKLYARHQKGLSDLSKSQTDADYVYSLLQHNRSLSLPHHHHPLLHFHPRLRLFTVLLSLVVCFYRRIRSSCVFLIRDILTSREAFLNPSSALLSLIFNNTV